MKEKKTIIIAEAGVNHNGDINKALELIKIASIAKADYVKFQTFIAETLVTKYSKKAEYQINNKDMNQTQFEMLKNLELTKENHLELIKYSKYKNIRFLSSPYIFLSQNKYSPYIAFVTSVSSIKNDLTYC